MSDNNIRKAIFALNSKKDRAFLIEKIPLENYPTNDTFVWWNGVQLVVCTTDNDVVDWFIDGNPSLRIVEEEPNEYHIMKVEHAPHAQLDLTMLETRELISSVKAGKTATVGGYIAGLTYTAPVCNVKVTTHSIPSIH